MKPAIAALALLLSACASTPPVAGNARGGMIDLRLHYPDSAVMAAADRHCARYGKRARITGMAGREGMSTAFECS